MSLAIGMSLATAVFSVGVARTVFGDLWWMAGIGISVGVVASSKLTLFLDALLRNPMMKAPLVTLQVTPTVASAVTLLVITVLGTSVPLRRVLRMDVMRAVQGGAN